MKQLKPHAYKLTWFVVLSRTLVCNAAFRLLYTSTHSLPEHHTEQEKILRTLIQKNPSWAYGHYLLGILSYRLHERTGNPFYKGTLRLSIEALNVFRKKQHQAILNLLLFFIEKKYSDLIKISSEIHWDSLTAGEKNYLREVQGFSHMILNNERDALHAFSDTPPKLRSNETAIAIKKLEHRI
jgi:hypothetical protein